MQIEKKRSSRQPTNGGAETHQFLKRMRAFVEGINPEAVLLCEACQPPETVRE
jgi:hypothetical protein